MSAYLRLMMVVLLVPVFFTSQPAQVGGRVEALDRAGQPVTRLVDGAWLTLRVSFDSPAAAARQVGFYLDDSAQPVAECSQAAGQTGCEVQFSALGWYWLGQSQARGEALRRLTARPADASAAAAPLDLTITPRPAVLVHGFASNYEAWVTYLGPQGFLASAGIPAYAVGDGQVPGVLNTGSLGAPLGRTNTLLENAAVLQTYIAGVKRATGAERVDLIVHSMGGMISRTYIDRYMGQAAERDVAQLIILGSPALGTDCSALPAALGWYLPAALEIRSAYAQQVLNPQFIRRKGVGFFALAGVPIVDPVGSPCTDVPNDGVIARQSVAGIPLNLSEAGLLHTALNTSADVFQGFVLPLLQKAPSDFADQPDPALPPAAAGPAGQFGRVFSGLVPAGGQTELVIPIEAGVSVANFALFDSTRSLEVVVIGASGKQIVLDPVANGELRIDDPSALVHLGYGFNNPKPGAWRVQLRATPRTPAAGAEFALMARFTGGATLSASTDRSVAQVGQPVILYAELAQSGVALSVQSAQMQVRYADGSQEIVPLSAQGQGYQAQWSPQQPGTTALDVTFIANTPDGLALERSVFLAIEVESAAMVSGQTGRLGLLGLLGLALVCVLLLGVAGVVFVVGLWWLRRRPPRAR